jgi:periplasmic protein CpxP/Spy
MKKSILIGLGLAVSVASTAIAQRPDSTHAKGERGGRGHGGQMEGRRGGRGGPDGLLLRGITLTEGQRSQIAQVGKAQRQQLEAKRRASKDDRAKLRAAHEKGDTAAIRVAREKRFAVMQQERAQRVAAIRDILTAEQRVQFDKNVAELKARQADRGQRPGRGELKRGR